MGLFGKRKILDLTEREDESPISDSDVAQENEETSESLSIEEKKKRLAKRIVFLTEKVDDLSNQIYHLQQRVDVLEKKSGVGHVG